MRALWTCVALLSAVAAQMPGDEDIASVRRILGSPVLQRIATELGLQIPELPDPETIKNQLLANVDNIDINALATNASGYGCLPEGVSFPESTVEAVRNCVSNVYGTIRSQPLAVLRGCPSGAALSVPTTTQRPRRRRFRFGRSLRDNMMNRAVDCAKQMMQDCVAQNLTLVGNGQVNETSFNQLIDSMTAPEEYKARKREILSTCVNATPSALSGNDAVSFQLRCISEMCGMDCSLGIADNVSPMVGLVARSAGSACFMGLEPTPQSLLAQTTCMSEASSSFLRSRLDAITGLAAGRRRRRRDIEDEVWRMLGGLRGIERALGVAPTARPCRPFFGRRCPPTPPPVTPITEEDVNTTIARIEEYTGPLGELFTSLPDRLASVTNCYFTEMGALNNDGSVDVAAVRAVMSDFTGDASLLTASSQIIDYCETAGLTSSAGEFHTCLLTAATYACRLLESAQEPPAMG